jgi:ABC-type dipeptide/oligopeptide/nickel transport system ATPase component
MSQRVMIAMAIACRPKLLIADEPTTALDVTIQAQIIELLLELQQKENMALVLITHDLALVAEAAHKIIVMYAGQVVETGAARISSARRVIRIPRRCARCRSLLRIKRVWRRCRAWCRGNMTVRTAVC